MSLKLVWVVLYVVVLMQVMVSMEVSEHVHGAYRNMYKKSRNMRSDCEQKFA
jgi:hypothetical protein